MHVHYLHTPASVVRYAALLTGRTWTLLGPCQGHLDDAGLGEAREARRRALGRDLHRSRAPRTSTALRPSPEPRYARLSRPRSVALSAAARSASGAGRLRSGRSRSASSRSGARWRRRALTICLQALAALPPDLHWRFAHVGGGELLEQPEGAGREARDRRARARSSAAKAQPDVIALLREADLFVLPSKEAASGDRDGLPNVLMEAASQRLAIVATRLRRHSGIHPRRRRRRARRRRAIGKRCRTPSTSWPAIRTRACGLGAAAFERLRRDFSMEGAHRRARARASAPSSTTRERPRLPA